MNDRCARIVACLSVVFALCRVASSAEIAVEPGQGTISAAAGKASAGDVLLLKAGEYHDKVNLPAGVSVKGAGVDATYIVPTETFVFICDGPKVTISDLTVRGDGTTHRAVSTSTSVRVERVRIVKVEQAVALMGAPLSDIVACSFEECGIGVRAIAESSPTVYGCVFAGGNIGILAMEGAPYVQNNLFTGCAEGMRLLVSGHPPILRNNTFKDCTKSGVFVRVSKEALGHPCIRNSLFVNCPAAIVMPTAQFPGTVTDAVYIGTAGPAVLDESGAASLDLAAARFVEGDPKLTVSEAYAMTFGDEAAVKGRGSRMPRESKDAKGDIGPRGIAQFGPALTVDAAEAPIRWNEPRFISNCVGEQYQTLRQMGLRPGGQSLISNDEGSFDVLRAGEQEIWFNISRHHGEMSIR